MSANHPDMSREIGTIRRFLAFANISVEHTLVQYEFELYTKALANHVEPDHWAAQNLWHHVALDHGAGYGGPSPHLPEGFKALTDLHATLHKEDR